MTLDQIHQKGVSIDRYLLFVQNKSPFGVFTSDKNNRATLPFFTDDITKILRNITQLLVDMTFGEITSGRLDR